MNLRGSTALPVLVIFCGLTAHGQSLSVAEKQRINALVDLQVEAILRSDQGIRTQAEILSKIMKFNLEVLNKRLRGAGLLDSTMQQYTCADSFATYPYQVVIRVSPECRKLPSYIKKAFANLALTTLERDEQNQLQLASDKAVSETRRWLDKRKDFADSVQDGDAYRPVPGPALKELYRSLFANVDNNKYKVDFEHLEFVPKAKKEYLEKPFDLFWKALGEYIRAKAKLAKQQK